MQAIAKYTRVGAAYGAMGDVRQPGRTPDDRMESFFLAETLKYLFLLQDPDHSISLETYVFNTEAHPLRIFGTETPGEPYAGKGHKHPLWRSEGDGVVEGTAGVEAAAAGGGGGDAAAAAAVV